MTRPTPGEPAVILAALITATVYVATCRGAVGGWGDVAVACLLLCTYLADRERDELLDGIEERHRTHDALANRSAATEATP